MEKKTGHIMVVDDEPMIRDLMQRALEPYGFKVSLCADGIEGVEFFSKHHADIDLVVLDVIMPRMGGEKCFQKLQEIDKAVKAVVLSAFAPGNAIQTMLLNGALAYIPKPFDLIDLIDRLASYVKNGEKG